jgi:hypothetical protein
MASGSKYKLAVLSEDCSMSTTPVFKKLEQWLEEHEGVKPWLVVPFPHEGSRRVTILVIYEE